MIDEAAMLGTRHLAALINAAHHARSKVILVGDPKQLPEIDAGGLFAAIATRIDPIHLTENRRQHDPTERLALDDLRAGRINSALDGLEDNNITIAPTADAQRSALVADWHTALAAGHDAVMIAPTRADSYDLNHRARHHLQDDGSLGPTLLEHETGTYAIGDRILCHCNDYNRGLLNGSIGTVTGHTADGLTADLDAGYPVTIPHDYLDYGHLTHGYALTVHKAQGLTCDEAFLLGDDTLYNELGYTGLSRGRHHNHLYTVTNRDEHGQPTPDPLDHLRQGLGISHAQTAAIDHHRHALSADRSHER